MESGEKQAAADAGKFPWLAKLEAATTADMQGLFVEAWERKSEEPTKNWTEAANRWEAMRFIILRWAELDTTAALAYFNEPANEKAATETGAISTIIAAWAEVDLTAAVAAAQAIPVIPSKPGEYKSNPLDGIGYALLAGEPKVFWEWFKLVRRPLPNSAITSDKTWLALARSHPDELLALANDLAAIPPSANAVNNGNAPGWACIYSLLARIRAEGDPLGTIAWAKELPVEARNGALKEAITALSKTDPQAAWENLKGMKTVQIGPNVTMESGADEVAKNIIQRMGEDPKAMLAWMKDQDILKSGSGPNAVHLDATQLASILGDAISSGSMSTAEVFASLRGSKDDGGFLKLNVLPRLYHGLPVETLRQAGQEVMASDSKSSKPYALAGVVVAWMNQDPAGAQAFLATITDAKDRATVAQELGRDLRYRSGSPPMTPDEIKAMFPVDMRAGALHDLRQQSDANLSNVAQALDDVPAGKDKINAMKDIASTWANKDPRESTLWAMQLADPETQRAALAATGDAWANQDEFGFSQWLQTQSKGLPRDIGAHRLASNLAKTEPDSAWQWATSIGDATERTEAWTAVLREWGKSSPADARAAAEAVWVADPSIQAKLTEALINVNAKKGKN